MDALQATLWAGGLGAFAGGMAGVLTIVGTDLSGAGEPQPLDQRLGTGAFLLASHAMAAGAIWQVPTVGSCICAGLGAGWLGAAAAGAVAMLTRPGPVGPRAVSIAARVLVGLSMLAPLWAYVKIIRAQALTVVGL